MTDRDLKLRIKELQNLACKHACILVAELPDPAGEQQVADLERFVGTSLPKTLEAFLRSHDGFSLKFYRSSEYEMFKYPYPRYQLLIYGTREIIARTMDFRTYIDVESVHVREQLSRCYEIANVAGVDYRLLFWLDAPRPDGEYAVLRADLPTNSWLNNLDQLSTIVVADSFEEFFERSFFFMLETEQGFGYWSRRPQNQKKDSW